MRGYAREIVRGATRPSLPALLGALVVALGWAVFAAVAVTPRLVAAHAGPVLSIGFDRARATDIALRLRFSTDRHPGLVLLGASDMREAVVDATELGRRVGAHLGEPVAVHDLTVDGIHLLEIAELAACLPDGFRGVLVIGISPTQLGLPARVMVDRLDQEMKLSGLACDAGVLAEEYRHAGLPAPPSTGIYVLDHFPFFASRRHDLIRAGLGHRPVERHRWLDREPLSLEEMLGRSGSARATLAGYAEHRPENLRMLTRILERARRRGRVEIVLVETPRNPELDGVLYPRALLADHRERLLRFAREHALTYCDLGAEAGLRPPDFTDEHHLRSLAAMAACTEILERDVRAAMALILAEGEPR